MIEILAIGGIVIAGLLAMLGFKNGKIEVLERENKVKDKINEIRVEQDEITKEILTHEKERIDNKVKANSGKSRRDRASKL